MAKCCSTKQLLFLLFNVLFLSLGLGLVAFVAWTLVTIPNANQFISGTHVVTLTSFCLGFVIVVIGCVGCIAGLCKGFCLLKTYVGFMVTLMFLEIGLVFLIYTEKSQIPAVMVDSWAGLNTDTQYKIQTELKCCGIQNYTEYGTNVEQYPSSCFVVFDITGIILKSVDTLYTANCVTQMQTWLNDHIPIWASVLLVVAVIECVSGITSCIFLQRVQKKMKVRPDTEETSGDNDTEMEAMGTGSGEGKDSSVIENEENDDRVKSPALIVVTPAPYKDIKDNTEADTIDYLSEVSVDALTQKSQEEAKDEHNGDRSTSSDKTQSLILVTSVSGDNTSGAKETKDRVNEIDAEKETLIQKPPDHDKEGTDAQETGEIPTSVVVGLVANKQQTDSSEVDKDVGVMDDKEQKPGVDDLPKTDVFGSGALFVAATIGNVDESLILEETNDTMGQNKLTTTEENLTEIKMNVDATEGRRSSELVVVGDTVRSSEEASKVENLDTITKSTDPQTEINLIEHQYEGSHNSPIDSEIKDDSPVMTAIGVVKNTDVESHRPSDLTPRDEGHDKTIKEQSKAEEMENGPRKEETTKDDERKGSQDLIVIGTIAAHDHSQNPSDETHEKYESHDYVATQLKQKAHSEDEVVSTSTDELINEPISQESNAITTLVVVGDVGERTKDDDVLTTTDPQNNQDNDKPMPEIDEKTPSATLEMQNEPNVVETSGRTGLTVIGTNDDIIDDTTHDNTDADVGVRQNQRFLDNENESYIKEAKSPPSKGDEVADVQKENEAGIENVLQEETGNDTSETRNKSPSVSLDLRSVDDVTATDIRTSNIQDEQETPASNNDSGTLLVVASVNTKTNEDLQSLADAHNNSEYTIHDLEHEMSVSSEQQNTGDSTQNEIRDIKDNDEPEKDLEDLSQFPEGRLSNETLSIEKDADDNTRKSPAVTEENEPTKSSTEEQADIDDEKHSTPPIIAIESVQGSNQKENHTLLEAEEKDQMIKSSPNEFHDEMRDTDALESSSKDINNSKTYDTTVLISVTANEPNVDVDDTAGTNQDDSKDELQSEADDSKNELQSEADDSKTKPGITTVILGTSDVDVVKENKTYRQGSNDDSEEEEYKDALDHVSPETDVVVPETEAELYTMADESARVPEGRSEDVSNVEGIVSYQDEVNLDSHAKPDLDELIGNTSDKPKALL